MARQAQEITRDEWHPFFDAFSGMHRGAPVTVEVRGERVGNQVDRDRAAPTQEQQQQQKQEVRAFEIPLEEIAAELGERGRISVVLRSSGNGEVNHIINAPTHVWLQTGETSAGTALEIVSAEGTTTLIRVGQSALPRPEPEFFA